jgi:hypothetical protein
MRSIRLYPVHIVDNLIRLCYTGECEATWFAQCLAPSRGRSPCVLPTPDSTRHKAGRHSTVPQLRDRYGQGTGGQSNNEAGR